MTTTPTKTTKAINTLHTVALYSEVLQPKLTAFLIAANDVLQALKSVSVQATATEITTIEEDNS